MGVRPPRLNRSVDALAYTHRFKTVDDDPEFLRRLADYATLVYHEARNVRHLIRKQAVEPEPWKYLVALPVHKDVAWRALQELRGRARTGKTPAAVLRPFEARFRVSLAQVEALYANQGWRDEARGGNAWRAITCLVRELAACLELLGPVDVKTHLEALGRARHNTGGLADKLRRLDEALGQEPTSDGD